MWIWIDGLASGDNTKDTIRYTTIFALTRVCIHKWEVRPFTPFTIYLSQSTFCLVGRKRKEKSIWWFLRMLMTKYTYVHTLCTHYHKHIFKSLPRTFYLEIAVGILKRFFSAEWYLYRMTIWRRVLNGLKNYKRESSSSSRDMTIFLLTAWDNSDVMTSRVKCIDGDDEKDAD